MIRGFRLGAKRCRGCLCRGSLVFAVVFTQKQQIKLPQLVNV
jgi:hypothetical protein